MRGALIIGIDHYEGLTTNLKSAIKDAQALKAQLSANEDQTPNFRCKLLTSASIKPKKSDDPTYSYRQKGLITANRVLKEFKSVLRVSEEMALFYFAGHGSEESMGGYLMTQDATKHFPGLPVSSLIQLANEADHVREIIIILDCCHSAYVGDIGGLHNKIAILRQGISIITATHHGEYALEKSGHGLFTEALLEGLSGGAADLFGDIDLPSLYAYIAKAIGPWAQRPVYKTYTTKPRAIRRVNPKIDLSDLKQIFELFKTEAEIYPLSPVYLKEEQNHQQEKVRIFELLQAMRDVELIKPHNAESLFHAALQSTGCQLTNSGRLNWRMMKHNL